MTLVITDHAVERALERYGLANIDRAVIRNDVAGALLAGRAGKTIPGVPSQLPCKGNAIYAWTPRHERIYVVEGVRTRHRPLLRVVTAIPSRWSTDHMPLRRAA